MQILNEITITTSEAQKAADICCGENAPKLRTITETNWLVQRNIFLQNVSYNGARSHTAIINVLIWFNQFNNES